MTQSLPPGQGPVDPSGAFAPPPPPGAGGGWMPPGGPPPRAFPMGPGGFGPMFPRHRRKRTILRFIVGAILLIVLLDLIGLNLIILGAIGAPHPKVGQVTVVDSTSDSTVAVIPVVTDLMTDDTASQFDKFLTAAEGDSSVKAIVLAIDTPGGSASAADAMHHRLMQFKANAKAKGQNIPVVVTMGGMATSGGYYVACGADYIFAEPATMTANIGVLMPRFNVSDLFSKYGIKETTIHDTEGEYKNAGSMFQPENPKDQAYLQGLIDATFAQFKKVVQDGRGARLKSDPEIFNGRVYMADDALKYGLIDKIGYAEDAYDFAATTAGVKGAKVVRYTPAPLIQQLLDPDAIANLTRQESAAAPSKTVNVNGVNIDLRQLINLLAPRPMYLWSGN
ncbi:MAG: signal peptide peptidase SppA [Tepidisphaeraceae bacterium]